MTKKMCSSKGRGPIAASVVALVVAGGMLAWFSFSTQAQERTRATQSPELLVSAATASDLEKAFWLCDYAASTSGVDSAAAAACGMAFEELKNKKFQGDFDALLAWWREHKPAEHRALEAVNRANAAGAKASPVSF